MKKITASELKANFESHYNHTYKTNREFINAAEQEYNIDEDENGNVVFSHEYADEANFIVTDWVEFDQKA